MAAADLLVGVLGRPSGTGLRCRLWVLEDEGVLGDAGFWRMRSVRRGLGAPVEVYG